MRTITPCLHAQKFQLRSFYSLGGKVRTTRPFKIEKTWDFSNLDVITIEKKVYQIFMIIYQAWNFHENWNKRFRGIICTKSVRKKNNCRRSRCEQRVGLTFDWPLKSQITKSTTKIMMLQYLIVSCFINFSQEKW